MCSCSTISSLLTKHVRLEVLKPRYLCQVAVDSENKRKRRPSVKHLNELQEHLSASPHLCGIKDQIPERFLKKNLRSPDDLYLIDDKVASKIAKIILPHIKNNTVVLESNPGFGFISRKLLDAGVPKMHLFEPVVSFRDGLIKFHDKYPGRIKLYNNDFFNIWKLVYQDRHDNGDRVRTMLKDVPIRDWDDDVTLSIIGALPTSNFIRHLLLSLIFQFGLMTYGRCDLFVSIPPPVLLQLTTGPQNTLQVYLSSSVLFQLFCDYKIIGKVPRKSFLPWDNTVERSRKLKRRYFDIPEEDQDVLYLTKITFKPLPVSIDKLQPLWFFVTHLMVTRKNRVIPCLEKWIPGSGIRLIIADNEKYPNMFPDMNIYTRIGDLTPPQILELFKMFSKWPEYSESSFLPSVETAILKMHQSSDIEEHHETNIKREGNQEGTTETEQKNENTER